MAGQWADWFEREELIGQISDLRVQNLQVEREVVQKRTFTRWMNLHLEKCTPPLQVEDLFRDIQDGRILMALLEELSGCRLLHGFKKSSHRIFRLNNIAKVLSFLEERNVKLVSIDAADVADGNPSIILGLIWNIILFFQIKELTGNIRSQFPSSCSLSSIPSEADASFCVSPSEGRPAAAPPAAAPSREQGRAIKKLLQWVQKRTRRYSVSVRDFGPSWTSGLAFLALIKSIDSGLVDMRKALLRNAKENLEDAFRIAHYSLGIPRLLEAEDVTINSPDEQSIMMYVSQFLEHFPGVEEPEESFQLIERSVSMGRLNHRHFDSDLLKNGSYRGRVKERSHIFQRDGGAKPPPKILISSVSEDRGVGSPTSRAAASRSWSSEDFLADPPHVDKVPEDPKKPVGEVLISSDTTHSPTGSSVPESTTAESSALGDSAISSPDSWVEGEGGSPLDSGTSWDVYRATPVEVTAVDEGFVPSAEDGVVEKPSIAESFIDEGIYSLSSLEINQSKVQGNQCQKKDLGEKEEEDEGKLFDQNLDLVGKQETNQKRSEATEDLVGEQQADLKSSDSKKTQDSEQVDPNQSEKDRQVGNFVNHNKDQVGELVPRRSKTKDSDLNQPEKDREGGNLVNHNKDLVGEQDSDLRRSDTTETKDSVPILFEKDKLGNHNKELVGRRESDQSETTKTEDSDLNQSEKDREGGNLVNHNQEQVGEESLRRSETTEAGDLNQPEEGKVPIEGELPFGSCDAELPPSSSGPEDQILKADEPDLLQMNHNKEPQPPPELIDGGLEQNDVVKELEKSSRELAGDVVDLGQGAQVLEDQVRGQSLHKGAKSEASSESASENRTEHSRNESESPKTSTEVQQEPNEEHSTSSKESLEDKDSENLSTSNQKEAKSRTNLVIPLISISSGSQELVEEEPGEGPADRPNIPSILISEEKPSTSDVENDHLDDHEDRTGRSLNPDKGGDAIDTIEEEDEEDEEARGGSPSLPEPMDLFYPDKEEEPLLTEPPDAEMQSWPSVLSVSALQPAPASSRDLPPTSLDQDFLSGDDDVIRQEVQEKEGTPDSDPPSQDQNQDQDQDQSWLVPISVRADPSLRTPPALRQRKGARPSGPSDDRSGSARKAHNDDSDVWARENLELSLLLLLWLLLYCFWVLPQMDLKMLLNH